MKDIFLTKFKYGGFLLAAFVTGFLLKQLLDNKRNKQLRHLVQEQDGLIKTLKATQLFVLLLISINCFSQADTVFTYPRDTTHLVIKDTIAHRVKGKAVMRLVLQRIYKDTTWITWETKDSTAKSGTDYMPVSDGWLYILPGKRIAYAEVLIRYDTTIKENKVLYVIFYSWNPFWSRNYGLITITD